MNGSAVLLFALPLLGACAESHVVWPSEAGTDASEAHDAASDVPGRDRSSTPGADAAVDADGHVDATTSEGWPRCSVATVLTDCERGNAYGAGWCVCHPPCSDSDDCPVPRTGMAEAVCEEEGFFGEGSCYLICEEDADCPDGMGCRDRTIDSRECVTWTDS